MSKLLLLAFIIFVYVQLTINNKPNSYALSESAQPVKATKSKAFTINSTELNEGIIKIAEELKDSSLDGATLEKMSSNAQKYNIEPDEIFRQIKAINAKLQQR